MPPNLAGVPIHNTSTLVNPNTRLCMLVYALAKYGKALGADEPVLLPDGTWKPIGKLQPGDSVASIDGASSTVYGVYPQGATDLVRITFYDGRSVTCTRDHLWQVDRGSWGGEAILTTDQIDTYLKKFQDRPLKYRSRYSIPTVNGDFGHTERLPMDPWLLGVLLGDGGFTNGNVKFSTADDDMLAKLAAKIAPYGCELKHSAAYDYRINGTAIKNILIALGLYGKYSYEKTIPSVYLSANHADRLELLQGLFDTDGTAGLRNQASYCSTSREMADQVAYLIRSLGGIATIRERHPDGGRTAYEVLVRHIFPASLFSLQRKYERCRPLTKQPHLTIKSVEEVPSGEAVCIAVTHPSRLYITRDFIVTHNTTLLATLDRMTKKYLGKPTLVIATEPGEGGGTMSIQDFGVDYVVPKDFNEYNKLVAALQTDTYYGGVGLDSSTEWVHRYLKPVAMKLPSKQRTAQREYGVPEWGDYQVMGEDARKRFNQLISLTTLDDLKCRKHLVVTALLKQRFDENGQTLMKVHPDLPGSMADAATAMFQTVATIKVKASVAKGPDGKPVRTTQRVLVTDADGVYVLGDRTKVFPTECETDLEVCWEKYWLPKMAANGTAPTESAIAA